MKATKTTTGVRNVIVGVMVDLLRLSPSITDEEATRHSIQCDGASWRNWVEIPSRLYYSQMERINADK